MEPLNLPAYDARLREADGKAQIFDPIRRKWVRLTPEEWVRQHVVQFLIRDRGVPAGLVGVEYGFRYQQMTRRADVVVYGRAGRPLLMVECKAPSVEVRQHVFDQVARYNTVVQAGYLVVTNGLVHYACAVDHAAGAYRFLDAMPTFADMSAAAPR